MAPEDEDVSTATNLCRPPDFNFFRGVMMSTVSEFHMTLNSSSIFASSDVVLPSISGIGSLLYHQYK